MHRVGFGYDIHRLVSGRKLFLGGIEIPYSKGLLGHSDGDALLHAVCDALLGAINAGDIGEHFSDSDPAYKDIRSEDLLKKTAAILRSKHYAIENIDTVVVAEEPKLSDFKNRIAENIAAILEIPGDCVSVKAKTNEGLDAVGKREAIVCYAVVLLTLIEPVA